MNDNENNNNHNPADNSIADDDNNIIDNIDNIEEASLPEQDEDTEYMIQLLAERKREKNASQTQTIERPAPAQTKSETKPKPETKPEDSQPKKRRFYNQDENESKREYQTEADTADKIDKITKLPIVPIILGFVVVAVIAGVIAILSGRTQISDNPEDSGAFDSEGDLSEMLSEKYNIPDWITVNLLPVNAQSRPGTELDAVTGAVVHYVGNPGTSAEQNRNYFAGLANVTDVYASSNFIIGLDGEILMLVPPDEVAYCSNNRNYDTLSIECCHPDDTGEFTEATYQSLIKLLAWMCEEFDFNPEDIIRHYDITGKECPKDYVVNPEKWTQLLSDVEASVN